MVKSEFLVLRNPQICNFRRKGWSWHFEKKSMCRPQCASITYFHIQNQIPGTLVPLKKQFQDQVAILKFSSKSTCRDSIFHRTDFSCLDSYSEGLKTTGGWFWVIFISIEKFWVFWQHSPIALRKHGSYFFYFEKHVQRTLKPPCTHFQTCWDFMSRLKPKSESGGTKNWKSVKGGV